MALLEVKDLSVRYEPKRGTAITAVQDVSVSLDTGEFIGLIGESGSGKTTLGDSGAAPPREARSDQRRLDHLRRHRRHRRSARTS